MAKEIKEQVKIKGEWRGFSLREDVTESHPIVGFLRDHVRGKIPEHEGEKHIRDLKDGGLIVKEVRHANLVPTVGRNVLARVLVGVGTPTGEINYIALGTGTTAFTNASVQLNNETFRKLVSDAAHSDNIAYVDVFIASGDVANQTFKEAAAFIDGTAGTNTGTPFSLVVQDFAKSGSMFISLRVTFT